MPVDINRLKASLSNSKMQRENNALYQTIFQLIQAAQDTQTQVDTINNAINPVSPPTPIPTISDLPHTFLLMGS